MISIVLLFRSFVVRMLRFAAFALLHLVIIT